MQVHLDVLLYVYLTLNYAISSLTAGIFKSVRKRLLRIYHGALFQVNLSLERAKDTVHSASPTATPDSSSTYNVQFAHQQASIHVHYNFTFSYRQSRPSIDRAISCCHQKRANGGYRRTSNAEPCDSIATQPCC
jgi:hypothetical protein